MANRRVTLTKKILREGLIELLQDTPLEHLSVKQLCAHVDLNRSTFYTHYMDIYDLYTEIENEELSHIPLLSFGHYSDESFTDIVTFMEYANNNKTILKILMRNPEFCQKMAELTMTQNHLIHFITKETENLARLVTEYSNYGVIMTLLYWFDHEYCTYLELAELLHQITIAIYYAQPIRQLLSPHSQDEIPFDFFAGRKKLSAFTTKQSQMHSPHYVGLSSKVPPEKK